ncbi:MAG: hypothetical protein LBT84_05170 [Spirochaetia bacterium]|jgi:hypothetical protein|nr:hypothetical protein [Spirochaetia bacterium]
MKTIRNCVILCIAAAAVIIPKSAYCAEERQLFYTYAGPFIGAAYNMIKYPEWDSSVPPKQRDLTVNGPAYTIGGAFQVYADQFAGDFRIGYMNNQNDGSHAVQHLQWSLCVKYLWGIDENIFVGTGLGIYIETPPASGGYDGSGGIQLPASFVYNYSNTVKLFADLEFRIGSYGHSSNMGDDDSRKMAIGLTAGVVFNVGRL